MAEQYGNFYKRTPTDLEFGVLDADKSITVLFGHTSTLDERQHAYIQSAVLYTTATGQRMLRTCNMALPVVSLAMNVFRYADADAAIAYWFRKGGVVFPLGKRVRGIHIDGGSRDSNIQDIDEKFRTFTR